MYYKNISYTISPIFVVLFMYLFISPRYSRQKRLQFVPPRFSHNNPDSYEFAMVTRLTV